MKGRKKLMIYPKLWLLWVWVHMGTKDPTYPATDQNVFFGSWNSMKPFGTGAVAPAHFFKTFSNGGESSEEWGKKNPSSIQKYFNDLRCKASFCSSPPTMCDFVLSSWFLRISDRPEQLWKVAERFPSVKTHQERFGTVNVWWRLHQALSTCYDSEIGFWSSLDLPVPS